ncbi:MAG TPA: hypothetical protein VKI44_30455 [Acetobacteraceae bacterium]|nr:hypothetical protein [Acetobacteraceae bacterium]
MATAIGSKVFWMYTTSPPAARRAALIRLTLGTMSRAVAISATWPGAMKPFCRSTTIWAVCSGIRLPNTRSPPRRSLARRTTSGWIAGLCMTRLALLVLPSWCGAA